MRNDNTIRTQLRLRPHERLGPTTGTFRHTVASLLFIMIMVGAGFGIGYMSAKIRYDDGPSNRITLTLGDYVGGETPCLEDEVFDHVGQQCIHVDRIEGY